ncbi:MAG TPA: putative sugar nucleotidyl transferase [Longimicrobiales bacterium]|nr:putative sugar nucleotidyl transferase [Longimicrobiales bacterium]
MGGWLVLFDDAVARKWWPFTLTRPAGELRFGAYTLRERAALATGLGCRGHIAADHLTEFDEPAAPPVVPAVTGTVDNDTLFLSSRAVLEAAQALSLPSGEAILTINGEPCGWFVPAGSQAPPPEFFLDPGDSAPSSIPRVATAGRVIRHVWELVTANADQLARDIGTRFAGHPRPTLPEGVRVIGDALLVIGDGVEIDPGVIFDLRRGPIWIEDGATVSAFTLLAGPAHVGPRTALLGGVFDTVAAGPHCKLRGEIQHSVVLGYSNKSHDGHLGHAYVGAWVNLGANTTNSDLKNNYGNVSIWTPDGMVDTGERKLGCLIGDHVKTAIGTLINTGTVIGTGANVFGNGFPPKYVPPFTWGTGDAGNEYDLEKFLATAATVMSRRNVELTERQRRLLAAAWDLGRNHHDA